MMMIKLDGCGDDENDVVDCRDVLSTLVTSTNVSTSTWTVSTSTSTLTTRTSTSSSPKVMHRSG